MTKSAKSIATGENRPERLWDFICRHQDVHGSWEASLFFCWLHMATCVLLTMVGCGFTQGELFEVDADHNTLAGVPWEIG